ncbi:MAG TPA: TIGR02757 family protein [Rhodothermales bacterium]|nr:TIGR02757 family protein [Rhodothermales bacterium]
MPSRTSDLRLRTFLDRLVARFETPAFVEDDPISIPHTFEDPRDREVIGFYAALLAWGRRRTILNKLEDLCTRMRLAPYRFVVGYDDERDGACLDGFVHRTFNAADARVLTASLAHLLRTYGSLEAAFAAHLPPGASDIGSAIQGVSDALLDGAPRRLARHLPRPSTGSACKRVCMYLRWMVRPGPVDFGQWTTILPAQLVLPLDVHSGRTARALGLLTRPQDDWRAALELTEACRQFNAADPARYDFAFFGAGLYGAELP